MYTWIRIFRYVILSTISYFKKGNKLEKNFLNGRTLPPPPPLLMARPLKKGKFRTQLFYINESAEIEQRVPIQKLRLTQYANSGVLTSNSLDGSFGMESSSSLGRSSSSLWRSSSSLGKSSKSVERSSSSFLYIFLGGEGPYSLLHQNQHESTGYFHFQQSNLTL